MDHLNEKQKQAVSHIQGPMMVVAGAGTGKTRVITERIAYLIRQHQVSADAILGLTFTEKAATEMEERLDILMPIGYSEVSLKTFHGFCDETLRRYGVDIGIPGNFAVLQGVRQWQLVRDHLFEFDLDYYRPMGNPTKFIDALISHFGRLKEEMISPEDYHNWAKTLSEQSESEEDQLEFKKHIELAGAYRTYQDLLIQHNYLDFADLQYQVIQLFKKRPNVLKYLQKKYQYVLVDEYQDTNVAQNFMVDQLCAAHKNIMVVGDDDQSIYKFRGAAISNILQFEQNYPDLKKVVLTENYRSNQAILDLAYASIQHNNPDRLEVASQINKRLTGQAAGNNESVHMVHCTTVEQEVEYVLNEIQSSKIPLSEMAILCRANAYAQPFIEAFKKHNIAYQFPSEKGLYDKKEIRDLMALLRVLANPTDDISFYRVLRIPVWNIPMEMITELIQAAKKSYTKLWTQIQKNEHCHLLYSTLKDLLEYSKNHSVGEVLYRFTESIQLYDRLLRANTIEAEEQMMNIARFFEKIRQFERESEENTVIDFAGYLDLADEAGENPSAAFETEGREGVQISTVHAAKGLEFHTVFVSSMVNRRFPSDNRKSSIEVPNELIQETLNDRDMHLQEERRLFYVAVTRAKERLHLMHSDFYNPSAAKNPRSQKKSLFLQELEGKVAYTEVEKTVEGVERFLKPVSSLPSTVDCRPLANGDSKITTFSYSQLSTFESCPRQYQYQYIYKIPQPTNGNLSFGSSMHNTLQEYYKLVGQSKQASLFEQFDTDLSLDRLLQIYEDKWIDLGYESRQHMELRKARGKEILTQFYEKFKHDIPKIKYLEKGFRLKIGDYTLSGRVDRADKQEDGTLEIIDYKSGKTRTQKQVDSDLQLMIYALAARDCLGIPASLLTLYFLDDNEAVSTKPTEEKMEKAKDKIIELANLVNESDFTPTPSSFVCQFCPYRKICDSAC